MRRRTRSTERRSAAVGAGPAGVPEARLEIEGTSELDSTEPRAAVKVNTNANASVSSAFGFPECQRSGCADFRCDEAQPVDCTEATGCEAACGIDGPVPGYEDACSEIDWCAPSVGPCTCPGEGSQIPLGDPPRDPMEFGMLALFNIKVDDLRSYALDGVRW